MATSQNTNESPEFEDGEELPKQTGLKILVVAMGIAIVVMLALIIWKIIDNLSGGGKEKPVKETVPAVETKVVNAALPESVERPAGSVLVSATAGAGGTLVLHFRNEAGQDTIVVLDGASEQRVVIQP